jgi:hypothetical protein
MKNTYKGLTIVLGLAVVLTLGQIVAGQAPGAGGGPGQGGPGGGRGGRGGAPAAPAGPVVRTPDGKPDFTGYWMSTTKTNIQTQGRIINPDKKNDDGTFATDGKVPYNAEWEAKAAEELKSHMFNEPYTHCLPAGVPTNFGIQMGFQAVQDKTAVVFAWDTAGATRVIYLDNRQHVPANIRLYQGDSIGHWEGDVLVVDTTSQAAGWWDANGAVHSDAMHVVERFNFKDANNIYYEALVEDPVALTRPMTVTDTFRRNVNVPLGFSKRPTGYEQTETACIEGEQDLSKYPEAGGGFAKQGDPGAGAPPGALSAPAPRGGGAGRGGPGGPGGAGGGRGGAGRGAGGGPPAGGPPPQQQ